MTKYFMNGMLLLKYASTCPDCRKTVRLMDSDGPDWFNNANPTIMEEFPDEEEEHWCKGRIERYFVRPLTISVVEQHTDDDSWRNHVYIYWRETPQAPLYDEDDNPTLWGAHVLELAQITGCIWNTEYHGGPGQRFIYRPVIHQVGRRTIISQYGGWDI